MLQKYNVKIENAKTMTKGKGCISKQENKKNSTSNQVRNQQWATGHCKENGDKCIRLLCTCYFFLIMDSSWLKVWSIPLGSLALFCVLWYAESLAPFQRGLHISFVWFRKVSPCIPIYIFFYPYASSLFMHIIEPIAMHVQWFK